MGHLTLEQGIQSFASLTMGRYAPSTQRAQKSILGDFNRRVGPMQLKNLRQHHAESYFYSQPNGLAYRVQPRTFNHHRAVINSFLRFCINRGWLRTDPLANIVCAQAPEVRKVRLTAHQLLEALELTTHPRDRAMIALAMNTGLRISEIISLKVGDVNLETGDICTTLHKNRKTDAFPISGDLDAELRRWLTFYAQVAGPLIPEWYLVPAKARIPIKMVEGIPPEQVPLRPTRLQCYPQYLLDNIFAELGVKVKGQGWHVFRRSIARLYYDKMLSETGSRDDATRITQALLNHSTQATTERYIGLDREKGIRDTSIRGRAFLTGMVDTTNVRQLRSLPGGRSD